MLKIKETVEAFGYDPSKLTKGSNKKCLCSCDYCGDIIEKKYHKWSNSRKYVQKDACAKQECRLKKQENNNLVKRGVKHHSQTKEYKDKFRKTCLEKYGVENPFANEEVKQKIKKTNMKKYGVEHPSKSEKIQEQIKKTIINKHQNKEISKKIHDNNLKKTKVEHYKQLKKLDFAEILDVCKKNKSEVEIFEYIKSLGVNPTFSDKIVLYPEELDIYIPDKKIAIEYNGLYLHSEFFKEKKYHFEKFKKCKDKEISLVQIFQDEWEQKKDVCKSLIANKLGVCNNKLFARKLSTVDNDKIGDSVFVDFFTENHLQGNTRFQKAFGLIDKGKIVLAISLRRPFTKKKRECIEIARLATKKDTVVVGGFSKLMKSLLNWSKESGFKKLLTYSDCRYSQGDVYEKYGFSFVGHTGVGYDYTDSTQRFNRFKFRARKPKTEKEVAEENGVFKIYNTGNYRWELIL